MATIRLVPSTYYLSSSSYLSVSNESNMYNNCDNTTYATVTNSRTSTTSYYIYLRGFNFDDIPTGATVNSFTIKLKARESGVSTSTSYKPYLADGTTAINGSCDVITTTVTTHTFTGISADWDTIVSYGSSFGIRINCRRASRNTTGYMYIYGAEIEVDYTLPIYHSITVTGTDTDPSGTTSVVEGSDLRVKIHKDAKPTVTDNGIDVTSQLQQDQDEPASYTVANVTTTYGFELNSNNYYESNNQAHSSSAAVCRVDFALPVECTVVFSVINYAEATYDYGLLSNVDATLNTNASADSSNVYWSGSSHNSSSVQTVTYTIAAGNHYVYVKYFKDQYTDSYNDSLQFKVAITPNEPVTTDTYWYYDLTNIVADHTIVVTDSGVTDKILFKNNGSWIEAVKVYKKVNGSWVQQADLTSVFDPNTNYVKYTPEELVIGPVSFTVGYAAREYTVTSPSFVYTDISKIQIGDTIRLTADSVFIAYVGSSVHGLIVSNIDKEFIYDGTNSVTIATMTGTSYGTVTYSLLIDPTNSRVLLTLTATTQLMDMGPNAENLYVIRLV